MMNAESLIKEYERFRGLTQEMLENVKNDDWDRIVEIRERREETLENLKGLDDTLLTGPAERARGSDLIRECLEMNGKMQSLIEEKIGELQKNYGHQKKLLEAYHLHSEG
jgi:hypothetical protein